jgi:putative sterol carrier protein
VTRILAIGIHRYRCARRSPKKSDDLFRPVAHRYLEPMPFPFLSDEWWDAAKAIREKYADQTPAIPISVRMNQVITESPLGDGEIKLYLDTSTGALVMEPGELDAPDLTLTTDYDTAKKLIVEQDQAAGMQAFMAGKIKVQGDMMKMMAMQTSMPQDDVARAIAVEIRDITE